MEKLRCKYNEIDDRIHKKSLEIQRITYKKGRGNFTLSQLDTMHGQIMRGYDKIKELTTQQAQIDKKIHEVRRM